MHGDATIVLIRLFALCVAVSVGVSLFVRRIALPPSLVLVLCGLAAGAAVNVSIAQIPPEVVLLVLVPGLIFEASYKIDLRVLRSTLPAVVLLAGPGVFVTGIVVALALHLGVGVSIATGFVVGAIVSATDPVAVVAAFRRLHAPRRLSTLVEAESLFNDGTGIVVFSIAVSALLQPITVEGALVSFVTIVVMSVVIGVVFGEIGTRLMVHVDDRVLELAISLLLAYGTYLVADAVHESGIIATAVAGIVLGNEGRRLGLRTRTFEALDTLWEFLAYLLTALVFLLVGLATPLGSFVGELAAIGWAVAGVLVARAILVYVLLGALRAVRRDVRRALPMSWLHVTFWSGLRGAIAVALALSLTPGVPDAERIQRIAFGVVLFTLVFQATTVDWLIGRLGIRRDHRARGQVPARAPAGAIDAPAVPRAEGRSIDG
ncbi:MAG TPA: sodium:proton antiporter [Candidatus Limnocylindrales bacterium]|nr:sodium:proton antiporter [Candidatus Limnocylindrales bacterium]